MVGGRPGDTTCAFPLEVCCLRYCPASLELLHTPSEGKQPGAPFHAGTLGEGMRAAIEEIERGYGEMIEGWKRQ